MKIKIRDFKGLYTNMDEADKPAEYSSVFKNIKVDKAFIEAKGISFVKEEYEEIPGFKEYEFVTQQYVFIDDDPHKNEIEGTTLKYTYRQNIQKYLFRLLYKNGKYRFLFLNTYGVWESVDQYHVGEAGQLPKIINENGILKVLFKEAVIWIGKLSRTYWNDMQVVTIPAKFYAEEYYDNYQQHNPFTFSLITTDDKTETADTQLDIYTQIASSNSTWLYEGLEYVCAKILVTRKDNSEPVPLPNFGDQNSGTDGYLIVLVAIHPLFSGKAFRYAIKADPYEAIFGSVLPSNLKYKLSSLSDVPLYTEGFLLTDETNSASLNNEDFYFFTQEELEPIFGKLDGSNKVEMTIDIKSILVDEETAFDSGTLTEYVVTTMVDGHEQVKYYGNLGTMVKDFYIKITQNGDIPVYPRRKEGYRFYVRNTLLTADRTQYDFVQFETLYILDRVPKSFPLLHDDLSSNGIQLTQIVGKKFDPNTYSIVRSFDDYVSVAGVPYVLRNSNVLYPAVGGGAVTQNFYLENAIKGVEGQRLISFGNLLGVFSRYKELMTLLDFNPVEAQMIFYVKDTLGYKIHDERNVVETTEGTFIYIREGIYITNGRERTLISEPINNIVKMTYPNANIYYNSGLKQLYYVVSTDSGYQFYCFDFETQAWIEYSLPVDFESIKDGEIVGIEDYEGGFYLITSTASYRLEYVDTEGVFSLSLYDLEEYSMAKRISSAAFDSKGKVKTFGKETKEKKAGELSSRSIRYLYNNLQARQPKRHQQLSVSFAGTIYGIEVDLEVFPAEKL